MCFYQCVHKCVCYWFLLYKLSAAVEKTGWHQDFVALILQQDLSNLPFCTQIHSHHVSTNKRKLQMDSATSIVVLNRWSANWSASNRLHHLSLVLIHSSLWLPDSDWVRLWTWEGFIEFFSVPTLRMILVYTHQCNRPIVMYVAAKDHSYCLVLPRFQIVYCFSKSKNIIFLIYVDIGFI